MTTNQINRLLPDGQEVITAVSPSIAPLLQSGLFVPSASRSYNGADYDFSEDGLYTIFSYGPGYYNAGNCISYNGNVLELMRSLAYLTQYGWRDEGLTASQAQNQMRLRKLAMRCGPTDAIVVKPICAALGVPQRTVNWLTAGTPTNFDDGHVACEVQIGGVWKYFDIPTKAYFEKAVAIQSAYQIAEAGTANLDTMELCAGDCYPETWTSSNFNSAVFFAQTHLSKDMRAEWRERIYQIPGIAHSDGLTYFYMPTGTESRESWVLSLSSVYRVISKSAWLTKFY